MPSRFLTLWSLLSKQGSSTQLAQQQTGNGSNKKKGNNSKKDADASLQVRYRSGPIIPVYGEQSPVMNPKRDEVVLRHKRGDEESGSHHHHHRSTSSVFRRSHFFRKSSSSSGLTKNHQSVDSLAIQRDSESRTVSKSQSVGGLSQRSLRVCQAKRVAPPIVPESVSSSGTSLNQQQQQHHHHHLPQQQHQPHIQHQPVNQHQHQHHNQQQQQQQQQQNRHSGSSFDSSSAESTSGGYCSGSGSLSSCHAPSSSAWSQAGSDQRSSLGLDDAFLPPPPASPAAHSAASSSSKHHMYSREGEPLYGSRGSPGYGSAGIFTYPSPTGNNSNGIYGTVGGYRTSQASFVMDHSAQMVSNGSAAVASAAAAAGVGSATLVPHPATYAHQISLEDQGIDLTQSPGRESPSSSSSTASVGLKSNNSAGSGPCRHSTTSTTSLDSGRASGTFHQHAPVIGGGGGGGGGGGHVVVHHQTVRYSTQASYESCLRNSYHSSSSSLGSSGGCSAKIDDIHRLNVCEMLSQGVPEHEILNAWLTDLGFEEYYDLFVQAGYDMHTITRMTPEDLTAIGIQKPNHRKKLKAEIALLHIPDGLPDFIPDTLEEWLSLLGLAEYSPSLRRQGYRTVEDVTQLTWEDLEDFGILRLGHQKKITLAIKRVKDILSGKYVPAQPPPPPHESHCSPGGGGGVGEMRDLPLSTFQHRTSTTSCSSSSASSHYAIPPSVMRPVFPPVQQHQQQHYHHHYQQQQQQQQTVYYHQYHQTQQPTYKPDVVAIQVHRNRSSEDVRAASVNQPGAEQQPVTAAQQTFYKPGWRQRSYEDGDANPAGELSQHHLQHGHQNVPGGGTLPRPRGTVKPRPVAKISAKTRTDCCPDAPTDEQQQLKASVLNLTGVAQYGTLGKKNPPPAPPKRANSGTSLVDGVAVADGGVESIYGTRCSSKSSPLPLPPPPPITSAEPMNLLAFSDDSDDFPPPPAPITASDSYMQHGQHASSAAASVRERLDNILQRTGAGHWPARNLAQPPSSSSSSSSSHYGVPNVASRTNSAVSGLKMVQRECSPSDSNETSDTEPGSPAMEFRQRRNGSDASFKSTSSTESDSMPFANDNAGTIKQRNARTHPALAALTYSSTMSPSMSRRMPVPAAASTNLGGASDVLNDIGNMLADLTDELDSMLEEENSGNNQQPIRQKS